MLNINISPKVSIILPFHNSDRFLEGTLQCIVDQNFTDFELILVNDNSRDDSIKIINKFSATDDRLRIIDSEGEGAVDAYNTGIRNSKAGFICIVDHDDLFDLSLIQKEYDLITSSEAISIVSAAYCIIDEKNNIINKIFVPSDDFAIKEKMKYMCSIVNSGSMVRKEVFTKYGYFNNSYYPAHDYEFYLRVMGSVNFYNIPEHLIKWRSVNTSPSQSQFSQQQQKTVLALKKYFRNLFENKQISKGEFYFNIARTYYYHESIVASIKYFFMSHSFGYCSKESLFFTFKSVLLWFPIKFYRDWLAKNKFQKYYKYKF